MMRLSTIVLAGAIACLSLPALAQTQTAKLPDGDGKALVEAVCVACHKTNMIERSSGYTKAHWEELIGTMVDLKGSAELDKITAYLAKAYPPGSNPQRAAKLMPGPLSISFKEWVTPTPGQRSRDPVEAADGSIWWAGQWANLIGRIDPATGAMKEWPLPDNSMPHTVTPDAEGNIWYTGNKNASVGKLDPKTGKITVYKMPDPKAKDPHTLIFDHKGIVWFTAQHANMMGRLDPKIGEIKLIAAPHKKSKPYGIKVDSKGNLWVACNGAPCIYRIDPDTMAVKEFKLPHEKTTVRRLDLQDDDTVWYVNSGRGRLGRLNTQTGEVKEWASPSGPKSHPYAIAVKDGIVWYNESGVRPDPLVRFDPRTETFQSWAIPSGNVHAGIIRHMRWSKDGRLLIHQSSTRRIIAVTIDKKQARR
jgi:virginiamycin B lyase